jgi:hypothetical protein
MPVCSLGVLPIVRELRRAGVPTAKLLAFALAAPMLNPITIVYGLTVLSAPHFMLVILTTITVSVSAGLIAGKWAVRKSGISESPNLAPATGFRRILNVGIGMGQICTGLMIVDVVIAFAFMGLAATLIPDDYMWRRMANSNPFAAPLMSVVSFPSYVSPAIGMIRLGEMVKLHYSLGGVIALHVFGVGANIAFAMWLVRQYGLRRIISLTIAVAVAVIALGFIAEAAFSPPQSKVVETRALAVFGRVSILDYSLLRIIVASSANELDTVASIVVLCLCVAAGVVIRIAGAKPLRDGGSISKASAERAPFWNRPIPHRWRAAIAVVGAFSLILSLAFVYYPPPEDLLEEMDSVQSSAMTAMLRKENESAIREIDRWDVLASKLPVAAALRRSNVGEGAQEAIGDLRRLLRKVQSELVNARGEDRKRFDQELRNVQDRCREMFLQKS